MNKNNLFRSKIMKKIIRKTKRNIIISLILTIFMCTSSILMMFVVSEIEENSKHLYSSIETHWREYTRLLLRDFESELMFQVESNELDPYNDGELNDWIINNLPFLKTNGFIDNFAIINIGYTVRDKVIDLEFNVFDNIDDETKELINSSFESILHDVGNSGIIDITSRIDEEVEFINNKLPYIDKDSIRKLFIDAMLIDDTTVDQSNTNVSDKDGLYDDQYWTESINIPNGILGFYNEAPYKHSEKNPIYRKVSIYVSVDKENILKNYDEYYDNTILMINIAIYMLIIIAIICIVTIAILFVNTINSNGGVYDADYNHKDSGSCDADSVHSNDT